MYYLKEILEKFYREYDFKNRIQRDPIEFPHRYKDRRDIEISGFIASCFAYGRVGQFKSVIGKILPLMGSSPYDFVTHFKPERHGKLFNGIKYRFNESEDIICMLFVLRKLLIKYSSVENSFKRFYRNEDKNIERGLSGLMRMLLETDTSSVYGDNIRPAGLLQFFPSPAHGSTCKRANLFLRWMVRFGDIDFGLWNGIPRNKLVIPLDTHIARISRCLGLTGRKTSDWKTAVEITETLKTYDPEDPLKYDFALCHHGISGFCRGTEEITICESCELRTDRRNA
jgi:uncharacterized protein (TIGR02757 family)